MTFVVKDMTGQRFGRLIVLCQSGFDRHRDACWKVECDCGAVLVVNGSNLRTGNTSSCGCSRRRGVPPRRSSPTYRSWQFMRARCLNANCSIYKYYGGRGIRICERWSSFETFLSDMGERPIGATLDRFPDHNGNYEPGNCRWATSKQQNRNRRGNRLIEYRGISRCLSEWAEVAGISRSALRYRLRAGWPIDRALGAF